LATFFAGFFAWLMGQKAIGSGKSFDLFPLFMAIFFGIVLIIHRCLLGSSLFVYLLFLKKMKFIMLGNEGRKKKEKKKKDNLCSHQEPLPHKI
jgi:hypothetical protein